MMILCIFLLMNQGILQRKCEIKLNRLLVKMDTLVVIYPVIQ